MQLMLVEVHGEGCIVQPILPEVFGKGCTKINLYRQMHGSLQFMTITNSMGRLFLYI